MDISKQRSRLKTNVTFLPGSRDIWGGPVIVILPNHFANSSLTGENASSEESSSTLAYADLVSAIGYLSEIPPVEAIHKGFTTIIDGRTCSPKTLRTMLRACQQALYKKIRQAIIVQPEKFLNQQKINLELILESFSFKITCVSVHKLSKFVHITQLPEVFGGTFSYDAEEWMNKREKIESTIKGLNTKMSQMRAEGGKMTEEHEQLLKKGEALVTEITTNTYTEDDLAAAHKIKHLIKKTHDVLNEPKVEAECQAKAEEDAEKCRLVDEHTRGVNGLFDWLEGAGEQWLTALHEIGDSRDEARQLVKEHAQLRMRTKEVNNQAKELADLSTRLMASIPTHSITLDKSRSQLLSMVAHFESRVERGYEMAQRSAQFHDLLSQLMRKADLLLDKLCRDSPTPTLSSAESQKESLEKSVDDLQKTYSDLTEIGKVFLEDLSANEVNPLGRPPTRDYSVGCAHIRQQLASASERRKRCLDLVDVCLLKHQQIIQLFTCERDAEQAVNWLKELQETLNKDYQQVTYDMDELNKLRADQAALEETARSTYEYGKQLCQVALVLRRSLRMEQQGAIEQRLEQTCSHLCRILGENESKLSLTQSYLTTLERVNERLQDLEQKGKTSGNRPARHVYLAGDRRRVANEIDQIKHQADLLVSQINSNHNATVENRQAAITRIRNQVDELTDKHAVVESLFIESPPEGYQNR